MPPPPPPASSLASRLFLGPALRTQPDRRLVALVRDGYENAFEEIVRRYGGMLGRFAASIVPSHRAEDVTQDAFSKALLALRDTDKEIELRPWLFRIVRNTALNDLRDEPAYAEELSDQPDALNDPAMTLERREELVELIDRLQALPEPQRAAIVMRELEGLSHEEIAAALGMSGGAARQAIYRARRALRNGVGALLPVPFLHYLLAGGAAGGAAAAGAGGAAAGGAIAGVAGGGAVLKAGIATVVVAGSVTAGVAIDRDRPERAQADENRGELRRRRSPGRPAAAAAGRPAVATPVQAAQVRAAVAMTAAGATTTITAAAKTTSADAMTIPGGAAAPTMTAGGTTPATRVAKARAAMIPPGVDPAAMTAMRTPQAQGAATTREARALRAPAPRGRAPQETTPTTTSVTRPTRDPAPRDRAAQARAPAPRGRNRDSDAASSGSGSGSSASGSSGSGSGTVGGRDGVGTRIRLWVIRVGIGQRFGVV